MTLQKSDPSTIWYLLQNRKQQLLQYTIEERRQERVAQNLIRPSRSDIMSFHPFSNCFRSDVVQIRGVEMSTMVKLSIPPCNAKRPRFIILTHQLRASNPNLSGFQEDYPTVKFAISHFISYFRICRQTQKRKCMQLVGLALAEKIFPLLSQNTSYNIISCTSYVSLRNISWWS